MVHATYMFSVKESAFQAYLRGKVLS